MRVVVLAGQAFAVKAAVVQALAAGPAVVGQVSAAEAWVMQQVVCC